MNRYDKLVQLKADIDDAIITLRELLERYESLEIDLDKTKKATGKLVFASDLSQEELNDLMDLYEDWEVGESVEIGDIRKYSNKLYRVIQAHTTQADWTPDILPALWNVYIPPITEDGEEIIPDFKQPTGAHNSYNKGDKVRFEGKVYESVIDGNTWSPIDHKEGWREVMAVE